MKLRIWTLVGATLAWLSFVAAAPAQSMRGLPDFTDLYEQQAPAVVSIDVTQTVKRSQFPDLSEDDPFYEFFRRFGQIPRGRERPRDFEQQSVGSGFILSSDGQILTNAHVVDEATEVLVKLQDKREFRAKVIGTDKRTDVALLKIDATGLPKVTIGDAQKLKVGEWVAAIGKPFGLENTITAGIVSAKGRELPQENNLVPFIQTDVPINPGNSGGPLFNMKGEVVGINSLIFSRTGGYMGLAFAIPIDVAMNVATQLQEKGRVTRGRIGVQIQEVTKETADAFGLPKATGALVNSVEKGGPAEKGGVESGDIILKAEGRTVNSSSELPRIVTQIKPGTKITLQVWRKGATKDLSVMVAELKEEEVQKASKRQPPPGKDKAKPNRMGLVLSDLNDDQKKELEIKNGVLIEDINGSARGNIQPGDVILAVINKGVAIDAKTAEQVNALIAKLEKGSSVTFLLRRGEQQFYSSIKIGNGAE